jgi:hypothetical protein
LKVAMNEWFIKISKWQVHGIASNLKNLKLQIGKSSHTIYKVKGYKSSRYIYIKMYWLED